MAAPDPSTYTTADWIDRLRPALETSVAAVGEAITSASVVQAWLRTASFEAAREVAQMQGPQAEAMAYMRLLDDFHDAFPDLLDAVSELTAGCGSLDIDWRPLAPGYTKVLLTFEVDYNVKAFRRLDDPSPDALRAALQAVAEALPKGSPYPNRPHEVAGLLAVRDRCLPVLVREYLREEDRRARTVVLPEADEEFTRLDAAVQALHAHLKG
jgi:hypothetical protein